MWKTKEIVIYYLDGNHILNTGWVLKEDIDEWLKEIQDNSVIPEIAEFLLDVLIDGEQEGTYFIASELFTQLTGSIMNIEEFRNADKGIVSRSRARLGEHVMVQDSEYGESYLHREAGMFIVTDKLSCTPKLLMDNNMTSGYNTSIRF